MARAPGGCRTLELVPKFAVCANQALMLRVDGNSVQTHLRYIEVRLSGQYRRRKHQSYLG
jgi:hypothetical protein